jgi:hypothetical protein
MLLPWCEQDATDRGCYGTRKDVLLRCGEVAESNVSDFTTPPRTPTKSEARSSSLFIASLLHHRIMLGIKLQ